MPALGTVTKTIRAKLLFDLVPGNSGCRFFVSYSGGPPNATDLNSFATAIAAEWNAYMAAMTPAAFSLIEVETQDLDTATGLTGLWSGSHPGTRTGNALPASSAAVMDFKIARHYRGGKPRIYLPCGTFTDQANTQTWGPSFVSAMNSAWGSFMAGVLAVTYASFDGQQHVNVSYYSGYETTTPPWRGPGFPYPPKPRPGPITPDAVTTHALRVTIGSQRRRLTAAP